MFAALLFATAWINDLADAHDLARCATRPGQPERAYYIRAVRTALRAIDDDAAVWRRIERKELEALGALMWRRCDVARRYPQVAALRRYVWRARVSSGSVAFSVG